jgi:hypothetical protein
MTTLFQFFDRRPRQNAGHEDYADLKRSDSKEQLLYSIWVRCYIVWTIRATHALEQDSSAILLLESNDLSEEVPLISDELGIEVF